MKTKLGYLQLAKSQWLNQIKDVVLFLFEIQRNEQFVALNFFDLTDVEFRTKQQMFFTSTVKSEKIRT